jgi:hypothetical protein
MILRTAGAKAKNGMATCPIEHPDVNEAMHWINGRGETAAIDRGW